MCRHIIPLSPPNAFLSPLYCPVVLKAFKKLINLTLKKERKKRNEAVQAFGVSPWCKVNLICKQKISFWRFLHEGNITSFWLLSDSYPSSQNVAFRFWRPAAQPQKSPAFHSRHVPTFRLSVITLRTEARRWVRPSVSAYAPAPRVRDRKRSWLGIHYPFQSEPVWRSVGDLCRSKLLFLCHVNRWLW